MSTTCVNQGIICCPVLHSCKCPKNICSSLCIGLLGYGQAFINSRKLLVSLATVPGCKLSTSSPSFADKYRMLLTAWAPTSAVIGVSSCSMPWQKASTLLCTAARVSWKLYCLWAMTHALAIDMKIVLMWMQLIFDLASEQSCCIFLVNSSRPPLGSEPLAAQHAACCRY